MQTSKKQVARETSKKQVARETSKKQVARETSKKQVARETSKKQVARVALINAEGLILGRMASKVAKRLLNGEELVILNAEKAILSGKRKSKIAEAKEFLEVGAPMRGPFHYRRPDRIMRKTVRGMLPFSQPKGKNAYRRLKVFMGVPKEFKDQPMDTFAEAQATKLKGPRLTLLDLSKEVGWNQGA